MIELNLQNYADPRAKSFNPATRCTYHSDATGQVLNIVEL